MSGRALPDGARRGWCPGLSRPMPTGDGLLARLHPRLGVLTLTQARAVAEGAKRYGNGHLDLTARANLQIRGVNEATRAPLRDLLAEAGLGDTRTDGGPQRLTLTGPLAGRDPLEIGDIPDLAHAIEAAGRVIPGLPAKTLVAVGMRLDEADLSIVPLAADRVAIALAPAAVPAGQCPPSRAPDIVAAVLTALVRTGRRRMRDVTAEEWAAALPTRLGGRSEAIQGSGPLVGLERLDGFASLATTAVIPSPGISERNGLNVLALNAPFGRCTAEAFERLIALAEEIGAPEIRLSPSRGMVLLPSCPDRAATRLTTLSADFIIAADDPRRAVSACTGTPACASGSTPTLADADRLAEAFRPFAARGLLAHVSGCAKGCARPGPADLTLVGQDGTYGIVLGGSPGEPPLLQIPIEPALERLGRAATIGLAAAFVPEPADRGRNRRPA